MHEHPHTHPENREIKKQWRKEVLVSIYNTILKILFQSGQVLTCYLLPMQTRVQVLPVVLTKEPICQKPTSQEPGLQNSVHQMTSFSVLSIC